jgi:rubrerythrin
MIDIFGGQLSSVEDVLQLGMKMEAQAFDLYQRLARKYHNDAAGAFYRDMAKDEHHHLLQLSRELDRILSEAENG